MKMPTALLIVCLIAGVNQAPAQQAPGDAPRVFLDCSHYCDLPFIKTEINWINWVNDAADAQLHVLVTRQQTGGGGSDYTLNFIGLKEFQGRVDTLKYVATNNDTEDIVRQGLAKSLKAGLVPYVLNTSLATRLQISMGAVTDAAGVTTATAPAEDPWRYWVFSVGARSNLDGESSRKYRNYGGNFSANRTTALFKIRVSVNGSYNEDEYTYPTDTGDTTITSIRKSYGLNLLAVRSFGDHWSAGFQSYANSATFGNVSLGLNGGPALEYSFFPYVEATRRSLVVRYSAGFRSQDYRELTIFDKMNETHPTHSLAVELGQRQRWGSTGFSINFSQYLHDTKKYNAGIFGNANVRVFKGFSVDFYGSYNRVRDQLSLVKRDLDPDEVLLRQRQLATGYQYFGGFGVRYQFGSIFNNVVNPRFGEGGGGGMMIMM